MWPFKPKPPEEFEFMGLLVTDLVGPDRKLRRLMAGFEKKLMRKGDTNTFMLLFPRDSRPHRIIVSETTAPFFIIQRIIFNGADQIVGASSVPAMAFSDGAMSPTFDAGVVPANKVCSIIVTCVGRPTRWQRFLSACRRLRFALSPMRLVRRFRGDS